MFCYVNQFVLFAVGPTALLMLANLAGFFNRSTFVPYRHRFRKAIDVSKTEIKRE